MPEWIINEGIVQMAVSLLPIINTLFVKSGSRGVLVVQRVSGEQAVHEWKAETARIPKGLLVAAATSGPAEAVVIRHFPALELPDNEVVSVTGAGDNLAGAMLAAISRGLKTSKPHDLEQIVEIGQR
jgi:pseudouridine-5'-phosphate glycosidase/pseudouridine kinase